MPYSIQDVFDKIKKIIPSAFLMGESSAAANTGLP